MIELYIKTVPKPRMTKSDSWKKRDCVSKYWAFKDELVGLCNLSEFKLGDRYRIEFLISMPESWSKKKKLQFLGTPHKQKPDLDNLVKSVSDCLLKDDSTVYYFEASKLWWDEDKLIIVNKVI